jgi:hypothetical protein
MTNTERTERARRIAARYELDPSLERAGSPERVSAMTAMRDLESLGIKRRKQDPAPEERQCERDGCTKMFQPTRSQLKRGFGKFCSNECDGLAHRIYPVPQERPCANPECPFGGSFTPDSDEGWNDANGWNKYCSKICRGAAMSGPRENSNKGAWVKCDGPVGGNPKCKGKVWRYDCELEQKGQQHEIEGWFCSYECHAERRTAHTWPGAEDKSSTFLTPAGRQKFLGRVNGHKGAAAGIEAGRAKGGRTRKWGSTDEETSTLQAKIYELSKAGLSSRDVSERVFGDRGKYKRVQRLLNS